MYDKHINDILQEIVFYNKIEIILFYLMFYAVGWDVKWRPVSRRTTPLARERPFHRIFVEE